MSQISRRFFIGIPLSDDVNNAILPVLSLLSKEKGIMCVSLENLHITLTFLGDVSPKSLEVIKQKLATVTKTTKLFSVSLSTIGSFFVEGKIRTVWIGVSKEILPLLHQVSTACSGDSTNRRKEDVPHITLARVKQVGKSAEIQQRLQRIIDVHEADKFGTMVVEKFVLYSSTLTPQGPEYTVVSTFLLG